MSAYPLAHFVADLEFVLAAAGSESDVLQAVGPLAQKFAAEMAPPAAADFTWDEKHGTGDLELYQAPDDGLFIALGAWQPGHGVPPHDHGTWTVVRPSPAFPQETAIFSTKYMTLQNKSF